MRYQWRHYKLSLILMTLLLAACRPSAIAVAPQPTTPPTPVPPTETPTPVPATETPTPVPATATPTPVPATATFTRVPPTATPDYSHYSYEDLIHIFDYDQQAPLDIEEVSVSDEAGVTVHDISYAGANGDRVSAFLVVPPGEGPFAGVVYLHKGNGSRYQFLNEASSLAHRGVVSLLVQGSWNPESKNFLRHIIHLRRGADLLMARSDVDRDRLAYVGHSWAGSFGGILAGVDKRFKTYVIMAGVPYWSGRGKTNKMIPFDAVRYVGQAAPSSLFFQAATQDKGVSQESSTIYFEAGSEPKRIEWYEAGHGLNEEAQQDRLEWLSEELKLP